jgi:hypothetical protein
MNTKEMSDEEILQFHVEQSEASLAQLKPQFEAWSGIELTITPEVLQPLYEWYMALIDGNVVFDTGDLPVPYWFDEESGKYNGVYIVNDLPKAVLYVVMGMALVFDRLLQKAYPNTVMRVFNQATWDKALIGMPYLDGIPNLKWTQNTVLQLLVGAGQYTDKPDHYGKYGFRKKYQYFINLNKH